MKSQSQGWHKGYLGAPDVGLESGRYSDYPWFWGLSMTREQTTTRRWGRSAASILVILVVGWSSWALRAEAAPAQQRILFYDPDANHQAIVQVSAWFNRFLQKVEPNLKFQALTSRKDFQAMLKQKDVAFAIVSSNVLKEVGTKKLEPLLVPAKDNDPYYRKLLLDAGQGNKGDLRGQNIAATVGSQDKSSGKKAVLDELTSGGVQVSEAIVMPVSKDIDALLALAFGQVQAALVTPDSLLILERLNPVAAKSFRQVYEAPKILRAPLTAVGKRANPALKTKLKEAFLTMSQDSNGRKAMSMLAFNTWMPFEPSMLEGP